jgi:hypothetical protein
VNTSKKWDSPKEKYEHTCKCAFRSYLSFGEFFVSPKIRNEGRFSRLRKWINSLAAVLVAFVAVVGLAFSQPSQADASSVDAKTYLQKSGIQTQGSSSAGQDELVKDANQIMIVIYILSGFWILICFIYAGLKLSASQGNPQNRTAGLIGLAFAGVGAFIVFQAQQIAGYIASLGM